MNYKNLFKNSCREYTRITIFHYLRCHEKGFTVGAAKATHHRELCKFYVNIFLGPGHDRGRGYILYDLIHDKTQELTAYLDKKIGFPLDSKPNYKELEPKFFDIFHELAIKIFDKFQYQLKLMTLNEEIIKELRHGSVVQDVRG
ncbi:MAG: hypothetical protein ACYCSQ_00305 [bacterium]